MDAEAYIDVLPWIMFVVIDRKTGLGLAWGGGCAAVCAAGLAAWSVWHGRRSLTAWVALALFTASYIVGMAISVEPEHSTVARAIALLVLALTAFCSLRSTPLSCTYTTAHVRPAAREDPRFDRVNAEITTGWGVGAMVAAGAYLVPLLSQTTVGYTFSDWVAPLAIAAVTLMWTARRWERFRLQSHTEAATQAASRQPLAAVIDDHMGHESPDAVIRAIGQRRNA
jgi:hypothetical protein